MQLNSSIYTIIVYLRNLTYLKTCHLVVLVLSCGNGGLQDKTAVKELVHILVMGPEEQWVFCSTEGHRSWLSKSA